MKTVKPSKNMIFAKPIEASKTTASGIFIPDKALEDLKQAEVVNIGSEISEYRPHDIIFYKEYSTTEVELDGAKFVIVQEEDVLGKVLEVEEGTNG